MKMHLALSYKLLGHLFKVDRRTATGVFLATSVCFFGISNHEMKQWNSRELTDEAKSRIYEQCNKDMSPFFVKLISAFEVKLGESFYDFHTIQDFLSVLPYLGPYREKSNSSGSMHGLYEDLHPKESRRKGPTKDLFCSQK